jgi:hypothetical protein
MPVFHRFSSFCRNPNLPNSTMSVGLEILLRCFLLVLCGGVLAFYFAALSVLLFSSPIMQCEVKDVQIEEITFVEGGVIVDKLFDLYSMHMAPVMGHVKTNLTRSISAATALLSSSSAPQNGAQSVPTPADPTLQGAQAQPNLDPTGSGADNTGLPGEAPGLQRAPSQEENTLLSALESLLEVALTVQSLIHGRPFAVTLTLRMKACNPTTTPLYMPQSCIEINAAPTRGRLIPTKQSQGGRSDTEEEAPELALLAAVFLDSFCVPATSGALEARDRFVEEITVRVRINVYVDHLLYLLQSLPLYPWASSRECQEVRKGAQTA